MEGTHHEPIEIPSDEEEIQEAQLLIERKFNQDRIDEAILSGDLYDITAAVLKSFLRGDEAKKDREIRKRLIKYFKDKVKFNIQTQYFFPRINPDFSLPDTKVDHYAFVIYGVDFMKTRQIRTLVQVKDEEEPQVIWIDDSSCRINYRSKANAYSKFKSLIDIDENSSKIEGEEPPTDWFQMKEHYFELHIKRHLFIRYAATSEEKEPAKKQSEKYNDYTIARFKVCENLMNTQEERDLLGKIYCKMEEDRCTRRRNRPRSRSRDRQNRNYPNGNYGRNYASNGRNDDNRSFRGRNNNWEDNSNKGYWQRRTPQQNIEIVQKRRAELYESFDGERQAIQPINENDLSFEMGSNPNQVQNLSFSAENPNDLRIQDQSFLSQANFHEEQQPHDADMSFQQVRSSRNQLKQELNLELEIKNEDKLIQLHPNGDKMQRDLELDKDQLNLNFKEAKGKEKSREEGLDWELKKDNRSKYDNYKKEKSKKNIIKEINLEEQGY